MQKADDHRFRLLLTDGEDTFKLAVYNHSQTGQALPSELSIITIADSLRPANIQRHQVVLLKDKFTLIVHHFTVVKEGGDVGRNLLRSANSNPPPPVPSLVTPPRAESLPAVEQQTPVKTGEQNNNLGPREGAKRDLFRGEAGGQSPRKVVRTDSKPTQEVANINPYTGRFRLKVMVEKKGSVRQINTRNYNGPVQDCVLTDSSGSIKMTAWNTEVPELDKLLEGKTYLIQSSGNKISPVRDQRFNSTNHQYEITWDKYTQVEGPISGDPVQVPYKFMKICELNNLPANSEVDVLAWVRQVQAVENVRARDGRDLRKREVLLVDDSAGGSSITLTLWNAQAETFTEKEKVIALRRSVVKEFNGRKNLSLGSSGSYEMSASCPGAAELQRWADSFTAEPSESLGQPANMNQSNSGGTQPTSSIQEIKDALAEDQSEKRFTVYGISIKVCE